jgi:acyl-CoA synthetase (AMP-forming)/AMP-acid ligase II
LDLSSIRLAFDGAEPIDRTTVEEFCERFARYGFRRESFYPVYGLAECTLGASFPVAGNGPAYDAVDREVLASSGRAVTGRSADDRDTLHLVSVGRVIPGHRIRVLARDGDRELQERQVGEIAIDGPSVTRGYWGRSARQGTELRTGDLGYVADGQLYVVDRLKDLVIIAGRNLVPSDVEQVIGNVAGVQTGSVAVFGVRGDQGTDELVVVAAIDPRAGLRQVKITLSRAVLEHFNVTPAHVCLVAPGGVPKTSSGKVQRAECRRLFESGALRLAVSVRPPSRSTRPPKPSAPPAIEQRTSDSSPPSRGPS